MMIIDNGMLWRQFEITIDRFGEAVRDCPDELWEKRLWEDEPDQWVASGFSTYWYLCYHTLFWLDLYLTGAEEGFPLQRHSTWSRCRMAKSCRAHTLDKSCSIIRNFAAESARRQ
jgi:hypothetical protein